MEDIRINALGILMQNNKLLLDPGFDSVKNERFYRPIGGGVEFGEKSNETLKREFIEELGLEIKEPNLLTVIENIFDFNGKKYHEITFLYLCEFKEKIDQVKIKRIDKDGLFFEWIDKEEALKHKIYPEIIRSVI